LEADLATQLAQLDAAGGGIDPRMIGQVLDVMRRHAMRPPTSITLLARALLTLEGTLRIVDPTFSLQDTSRQLITDEHQDAFGTPQEILQREALHSLPALRTLPEHAETLANQLRSGRLTVRPSAGRDRHRRLWSTGWSSPCRRARRHRLRAAAAGGRGLGGHVDPARSWGTRADAPPSCSCAWRPGLRRQAGWID
jgi:ubiquinone biosynthesis protein